MTKYEIHKDTFEPSCPWVLKIEVDGSYMRFWFKTKREAQFKADYVSSIQNRKFG